MTLTIQVRRFNPDEITEAPTRADTFGDAIELIDFGTISKINRFSGSNLSGSLSDPFGIFIRIYELENERGIEDLKFYMINSDGLRDSEVRYHLSNRIETSLDWNQMKEIKDTASESEVITSLGGSNQIMGLSQFSQVIYLQMNVGFGEQTGEIGGSNVDNFKFACQYKEIKSGLAKIVTLPARVEVKPHALDQILKYLPSIFEKSEESNIYRLMKICALEKDQVIYQSQEIKEEHWIDTAHYVEN